MTLYNLVFTALPVLYVGLFEKDVREVVLEQQPEAYRAQRALRWWTLLRWLVSALYHSLCIFFVAYFVFRDDIVLARGQSGGLRVFGVLAMLLGFHLVLAKLALETTHHTLWSPIALIASVANFHIWQFVESVVARGDAYGAFPRVLGAPIAWLAMLLTVVAGLVVDICYAYLQRQIRPQAWQILQEKFAGTEKRAQRRAAAADDSRAQPLLAMRSESEPPKEPSEKSDGTTNEGILVDE